MSPYCPLCCAGDICTSLGMRMATLSDVDCEDYSDKGKCCKSDTIYGELKLWLKSGFWTADIDASSSFP